MNLLVTIAAYLLVFSFVSSCADDSNDLRSDSNSNPSEIIQFAIANPISSSLFGSSGSSWNRTGRIADFQHAGLPGDSMEMPPSGRTVSIDDFGGNASDTLDDSMALVKAIAALSNGGGIVSFSPGTYTFHHQIKVNKSNVILRGAGRNQTTLKFRKGLLEVAPPPAKSKCATDPAWSIHGCYAWSGGLISFESDLSKSELIANVSSSSSRGAHTLSLDKSVSLNPGDLIQIGLTNPTNNSLANHLHAGQIDFRRAKDLGQEIIRSVNTVQSVSGNTLTIKEPLMSAVSANWQGKVYKWTPGVRASGIQGLKILMESSKYAGHHKEKGFNALNFRDCYGCRVFRVDIVNADSGLFFVNSSHNLVDEVTFTAFDTRKASVNKSLLTSEVSGHYGIAITGGSSSHNLVKNIVFNNDLIHEFSVAEGAHGNVFSKSRGLKMQLDHHGSFAFSNLYTELDVGAVGDMVWASGGGDYKRYNTDGSILGYGPAAGAWNVFWNIKSSQNIGWPVTHIQMPRIYWAPNYTTVVGVPAANSTKVTSSNKWYEPISPERLEPQNLYEAMKMAN